MSSPEPMDVDNRSSTPSPPFGLSATVDVDSRSPTPSPPFGLSAYLSDLDSPEKPEFPPLPPIPLPSEDVSSSSERAPRDQAGTHQGSASTVQNVYNHGILSPAKTVPSPGRPPLPRAGLKRARSLDVLPRSPSSQSDVFFGPSGRLLETLSATKSGTISQRNIRAETPGPESITNHPSESKPPNPDLETGQEIQPPSVAEVDLLEVQTESDEKLGLPPPTPNLGSSPRLRAVCSPQPSSLPSPGGPSLRRRPKFWRPSPGSKSKSSQSSSSPHAWESSLLPSLDIKGERPAPGRVTKASILPRVDLSKEASSAVDSRSAVLFAKPSPPPPVPETAESRGKLGYPGGRKVVLKPNTNIAVGETIMAARISFATLHTKTLSTHCSGCLLAPSDKVRRLSMQERKQENIEAQFASLYLKCSRCKVATFCSARCYAKSAMSHLLECRALQRCRANVPSAETRLIARAFWAGARDKIPSWIRQCEVSCSDVSSQFGLDAVLEFMLGHDGSDEDIDWSNYRLQDADDALEVIQKIRTMMFPLRDGLDRVIGWAVAITPSRIGHSCNPTAFISYPEGADATKPLRITSLADQKGGDELTVSYIDETEPCQQRDQWLADRGFKHDSSFCSQVRNGLDIRWGLKHLNCPDAGLVPFIPDARRTNGTTCSGCHRSACATQTQIRRMLKVNKRMARFFDDGPSSVPQKPWLITTERSDWKLEYQTIAENIALLRDGYSESFHTVLRLRHRCAAAIILSTRTDLDDLLYARQQAQRAYIGCQAIYGGRRPILVQLLLLQAAAVIGIVRHLMEEWRGGDPKAGSKELGQEDRAVTGKLSELTLLPSPKIGSFDSDDEQASQALSTSSKRAVPDARRRREIRRQVPEYMNGAEWVIDRAKAELKALRGETRLDRDELWLEAEVADDELRGLIDQYGDMIVM